MAASANSVESALRRIAQELCAAGHAFALIGGLAVSARAEPRTTRDVDIAVGVASDEAAAQIIWHLQARGYIVRTLLEQERTGRLATVRLVRDTERSVFVDLLFASSGIESEIVRDAEELDLTDDIRLPVATRGHLVALKALARDDRQRPQDWDDLRALLTDASDADLQLAGEALALIEQREFNRGRDLRADFARAISDCAPGG